MVSDGTEFAMGDIEKLFEEVRSNAKIKHEKWPKYYNRMRQNIRIKINDWVLLKTHPLSSATMKKVVKFKPKFEGPYRVLKVQNNNLILWKVRKRITVDIDKVRARIYHQRKSDENVIKVGNSDSRGSEYKACSFESVRPRSDRSESFRNRESGERRGVKGKTTSFAGDQDGRLNYVGPFRKKIWPAETSLQQREVGPYNLRPRVKVNKEAGSRSSRGEMQDEGGSIRSRGKRFQEPRPYSKNSSYRQESRRQSSQESEQEPIKSSESTTRSKLQIARAPEICVQSYVDSSNRHAQTRDHEFESRWCLQLIDGGLLETKTNMLKIYANPPSNTHVFVLQSKPSFCLHSKTVLSSASQVQIFHEYKRELYAHALLET
ncbi:hypothetical protein TNCV_3460441 [Trichonephila clavipes]|nr:hypothetical protein TNCV_3460441 [Trichonephila clavipes]